MWLGLWLIVSAREVWFVISSGHSLTLPLNGYCLTNGPVVTWINNRSSHGHQCVLLLLSDHWAKALRLLFGENQDYLEISIHHKADSIATGTEKRKKGKISKVNALQICTENMFVISPGLLQP